MLADYHVHTPYCGHARGKTVEYVEAALAQGLSELGFSDHLGRYYLSPSQRRRYWDWGMDGRTLDRYFDEVTNLRDAYADRIAIRIGLEVDYIEGAEELVEPLLTGYPLDFLLGSIHCLPRLGWHHLSKYASKEPIEVYREYFRCAEAAVASGMFQSLAHLDFVWRYVPWPDRNGEEILQRIRDISSAAAGNGTALEMNVNGFLWSTLDDTDRSDPFAATVAAARKHRTRVSLGSDAHMPGAVGRFIQELAAFLRKNGLRQYATFEKRVPSMVQLP
jgi:histidinol-phosphatase (PHP family)